MRTRNLLAAGLALALAGATPQAAAHHCFDTMFDADAPVALSGKVLAVQWINPHAKIYVRVEEAGRPAQDWVFWAGTPNTLLRGGASREMLRPGTEVSVQGWRGLDKACPESPVTMTGVCTADGRVLTLADGRKLFIGSTGTNAPPDAYEGPRAPAQAASTAGAGAETQASWCPQQRAAR